VTQWFFRLTARPFGLCLGLLPLLCCLPVWGQNAVVSGRVVDSSGAAVPAAALELRNSATNVTLKTATNTEGLFVFPPVIPGIYDISAAAPVFPRRT